MRKSFLASIARYKIFASHAMLASTARPSMLVKQKDSAFIMRASKHARRPVAQRGLFTPAVGGRLAPARISRAMAERRQRVAGDGEISIGGLCWPKSLTSLQLLSAMLYALMAIKHGDYRPAPVPKCRKRPATSVR